MIINPHVCVLLFFFFSSRRRHTRCSRDWSSDVCSSDLVPRPVLKLIVEHPVLAPYLHPETPGRVPLLVSDHLLEPGVTPSRFGQPLRIVPDRELGTKPHLRVLSFEVDGARAKAVVEYKVEGVQAVFDLRRDSKGWWTVADAKVAEVGRGPHK